MVFFSLNLYDMPGLLSRMNVLFWGPGHFPVSYWNGDTSWNAWNRHSRSVMVDKEILLAICSIPLTNVKWHSNSWPTVTSQPIRGSTNLMTLITSLTLTELWVVSMEHLHWVWHAGRERFLFRTPGSVPFFGTSLCSNCWDQIPHVFTRLFTLNIPWYFLDFASWFWKFRAEIWIL